MGDTCIVVPCAERGFPLEVCVNKPHRKYLCMSCLMILREPFQTVCGHRFCHLCIHGNDFQTERKCPECNQELQDSDVIPDYGIRRDMKGLQVRCLKDCNWKGKFCDYPQHEKVCLQSPRWNKLEFEPLEIMNGISGASKYKKTKTSVPGLAIPVGLTLKKAQYQTRNLEQNFLSASNDGTLLWMIDNFSQHREEAMYGQKAYLDSHPFMTNVKGYRLRARLYPNGNGYSSKGTHLSLFVSLMEGPNDENLQWPFRQKIKVEMLDQNVENQKHWTDHIHADPNHPAFRKPESAHNSAMGLVKFMPLDQLDNPCHTYILDDTVILQITVDLFGL